MAAALVPITVIAVGIVACVTDVRTRRIPNVLTFGAAGAALVFRTIIEGWHGAALAGAGWLTGLAVFLPFFLLRGMGAGDVKLLAALGAWLGPLDAIWLAIYASLAGGVLALIVAARHRYLRNAFSNLRNLMQYWWLVGPKPLPELTLEGSTAPRLAYAIPIFVGTVVTLWLR